MPKQHQVTTMLRLSNRIAKVMTRMGIAPKKTYILTVRGRKSGKAYSTPVALLEQDGQRYIVAPFGEVNWVRNARAAGQVMLSKGGRSESVSVEEIPPQDRASLLKAYFNRESFLRRSYTDFAAETTLEDYAQAANNYPVFKVG